MVAVASPDDSLLGRVLSNKYRVQRVLGRGGFGCVYAATNLTLGTEVAIKVARGPTDEARSLREAQAGARLTSPHSVRVFDVGRLDDSALYIVMEYLRGRSLREYLTQEGPLPLPLAVEWLSQACSALQEAHGLGLVHRDIKPSNLFVVEGPNVEPHVKLLDFGLAKSFAGDAQGDLTDSGRLYGSPHYMSPEQVRAGPLTPQSDVWSLGVVLYECLSGRLPFERETPTATLVAIAADPPRPLHELDASLPAALLALSAKCLRKAPQERFSSMTELLRELGKLRDTGPPGATTSEPRHAPRPTDRHQSSTLRSLTLQESRVRRSHPFYVPAIASALALAGAAWWWLARSPPTVSGNTEVRATPRQNFSTPSGATDPAAHTSAPDAGSAAPREAPPPAIATTPVTSAPVSRRPPTPASPPRSGTGGMPSRLALEPDF